MSNFFGQMMVEKMDHVASLSGSLCISFIPIVTFMFFMPETFKTRGTKIDSDSDYILTN